MNRIQKLLKPKRNKVVLSIFLILAIIIPITILSVNSAISPTGNGTNGWTPPPDKPDFPDWIDYYNDPGDCEVIEVYHFQGRYEVTRILDNNPNQAVKVLHQFDEPMLFGTIEFWIAIGSPLNTYVFELLDHGGLQACAYWTKYEAGLWWGMVGTAGLGSGNSIYGYQTYWRQYKIQFEFTDGGYCGLGKGRMNAYVEGRCKLNNYYIRGQDISQFQIRTGASTTALYIYVDGLKTT